MGKTGFSVRRMKLHYIALLLMVCWAMVGASTGCECTNPFVGQPVEEMAEPEKTCNQHLGGFCFVSCTSGCSDVRPGSYEGTCWSEIACPNYVSSYDNE